jgi:hypothetical protein
MLALVLSKMHFSIIECNYEVTYLSIFVMYDGQYDAAEYGSKINWISIFANHKGTTCMLNALVLIFDGVHLRKMFGFINLLFKLNMYVSSSRCNRFKNSKNVMFSLVLKSF